MEMKFNITSSEYGDMNEYQIKQIVCTAINNMLWYFIEIAVIANLIFFIFVMGCMYFCNPSRLMKGKMKVEVEDVSVSPSNNFINVESSGSFWKSIAAMVTDAHCDVTTDRCEEFDAPPSYDEFVHQHPGCMDSQLNEKKCPGYVLINVEQK